MLNLLYYLYIVSFPSFFVLFVNEPIGSREGNANEISLPFSAPENFVSHKMQSEYQNNEVFWLNLTMRV